MQNTDGSKRDERWLSSKETQKALKISSCELMHRRERGDLEFKKEGNAYFYYIPSKKAKK